MNRPTIKIVICGGLVAVAISLWAPHAQASPQEESNVGPCHALKMKAQNTIIALTMQIDANIREGRAIIRSQHDFILEMVGKHNALLKELDKLKAGVVK